SLILGTKQLAEQLKMTRKNIFWVPHSSGDFVNVGLDVGDEMVSGLSYVSRQLPHPPGPGTGVDGLHPDNHLQLSDSLITFPTLPSEVLTARNVFSPIPCYAFKKTPTTEDGPWSQQAKKPEATGKADARPWRSLIPFRPKPAVPSPHPLDDAGLFSYLTVSWLNRLMVLGLQKRLDESTTPKLSVEDASAKNAKRLHRLWEEEVSRHGIERASVFRVMLRFQRTRIILIFLMSCCFSIIAALGPMLILKILEFSEAQSGGVVYGAGLCVALFATECLKSIFLCSCWIISQRTGIRTRTATSTLAFEKLMQFKSLAHITTGEVISFFASDISYLFEAAYYGPLITITSLLLVACTVTSCLILGPTALISTVCYLLILPLEAFLVRSVVKIQKHTSAVSDQRIRVTSEVLTCIKLIKMYTWEKPFAKVIKELRSKERKLSEKCGFVQSLTTITLFSAPTVATVVMFLVHTCLQQQLSVPVVSVWSALTPELTPSSLSLSVQRFFLQESPASYVQTLKDPSKVIVVEQATLSWQKTCLGIVNGGLEPEGDGHALEQMRGVQPPPGAHKAEDKRGSLGPELHKINLVVPKVAVPGRADRLAARVSGLEARSWAQDDHFLS
ncbi:ATP-binding cassette sub-family C member 11, partial [Galemys pyrenaicus]